MIAAPATSGSRARSKLEQVDALAKASLREPALRFASAAFLKQKAYLEMLGNWQTEMRSTKFSGKDFPRQRLQIGRAHV